MLNCIGQFGVKQRCMEGTKQLTDLFLTALHYEHDVNFYIYEGDYQYLGTINRELLLALNLSTELCHSFTLGELCKKIGRENLEFDVVYWGNNEDLGEILNNAFQNIYPFSEEVAVVEKNADGGHRLGAILKRRDVFHELYAVSAENETELVCYREFSHYYKQQLSNYSRYAKNINSQHGEDGILEAIFNKIGTSSKYAVEFGGWDGVYLSNIRHLITDHGFSGLFIEGEKERAGKLLENYKDYPNVQCVVAYVGFRGEYTLDHILEEKNAPEQIDLISIDIDGYDYHVWEALRQYRPRVILIEYNPSIQNDMVVVNPRSETSFCGSSAAALVELGRRKGYCLVAVTETNLIFVVEEEYGRLEIWDNDLNVLRAETRLGNGGFFQTYDKRVMLTGFTYYIWDGGKAFETNGKFELLGDRPAD